MKRDFINLAEYSSRDLLSLLDLAGRLKENKGKISGQLRGKTLGLIFQKPSNRTRVSFEVGIHQLGGHGVYLGPDEINLGKREATSDVAQTLSRYVDGIVARTHSHQDIVDLARYSTVPVINGLSDLFHPCQAMADILTIRENFGTLKGLKLAYIGDGNNVCHSLLLACAKFGIDMAVAAPKGYFPSEEIFRSAQEIAHHAKSRITLTNNPEEAVKGAHVIYTDTWVSMGQEAETKARLKIFKNYQINAGLAAGADTNFIFMHCLPAHRGQEVTDDVIDGPHSVIFDQAENRLHAQKAILLFLLTNKKQRGSP
jgi:ornithine carbamoyltransferase